MNEWKPIQTAPIGREMFVVKAFDVFVGFSDQRTYTSDPYCVWQPERDVFERWPHPFLPTHWLALPKNLLPTTLKVKL